MDEYCRCVYPPSHSKIRKALPCDFFRLAGLFVVLKTVLSVLIPVEGKFYLLGGMNMTDEQRKQIIALRREGVGYGRIATELNLSINTIKSFCRRNSLVAQTAEGVCETCGKPIHQNPKRKRKRFCSDACRNKWWNAHLNLIKRKAVYTFTCPTCGKEFTTYGNRHRKFCSHACYIAHRFGGVDIG